MTDLVRVVECESLAEAEATRVALAAAGVESLVQGAESGRIMGQLIPARYPVLVNAAQADSARALIDALRIAAQAPAAPQRVRNARRYRVLRAILGFNGFLVVCSVCLALAAVLAVGLADALHPTARGHVIESPIPFPYFVIGLSLLLSLSRRLRKIALFAIPIAALILAFASVRPREANVRGPQRPHKGSWSVPW